MLFRSFSEVMSRMAQTTGMEMTASAHMTAGENSIPTKAVSADAAWDALDTSSSVSLEQEMLKAGEVSRDHNLNTGVVKAFHRMLMSAVRSG